MIYMAKSTERSNQLTKLEIAFYIIGFVLAIPSFILAIKDLSNKK